MRLQGANNRGSVGSQHDCYLATAKGMEGANNRLVEDTNSDFDELLKLAQGGGGHELRGAEGQSEEAGWDAGVGERGSGFVLMSSGGGLVDASFDEV